ncbi:hypothetical protein GCG21_12285 [Pseudactinotalea sp. HY160]|uniref:hypothetical protein n=1 Tax=Pseudactinotalea sp. HY160 TaxID=2654490 RepID=UPI00128B8CFC|nr:hypothetical protein [Pseudactinotalea sp. HY160]MPV50771.1 hypothetical protein [Pseudactinotalea sp. HY160]
MSESVALLEREVYTEADAARLLRVPQATLHYWLEGRSSRGERYLPILRVEATGRRTVTWAEFVEAGLLRQYRRTLKVSMAELRRFIEILRDGSGVPYPLATARPWAAEGQLIIEAQDQAGLPADFWLYAPSSGQRLLLPPADDFLHRAEFDGDVVSRWRVDPESGSPVRLNPDQRFGQPSVGGISTSVLWEYSQDGYANSEIAEDFGLSDSDVSWAVAFESSLVA